MHSTKLKESTQACPHGCFPNPIFKTAAQRQEAAAMGRSTTSAACRQNFAATTKSSFFSNYQFTDHESIPLLQESFDQFVKAYPKYADTEMIDRIRARDYSKLSISNKVCLDYIGVGLFSHSQIKSQCNSTPEIASAASSQRQDSEFPLFGLTFRPVNLKTQLLHGGEGSGMESAIRKRIMDFLRISEDEYYMVFTANRSSAFKLLAESYPFQSSKKLLTVYDHENEAIEGMVAASKKRGARVMAAEFKWPRLKIHSVKLMNMLVGKKKKKKHTGLFVFPLLSRMTGASYSYRWMNMAQENRWHVLLDACELGPKGMDSFGLSLFRPDFLVCSFYKIFGENPTGFGCLFVKKSSAQILEDSTGAGIVSIIPVTNMLGFPEDSSGTDTELEQKFKIWTDQYYHNASSSHADDDANQRSEVKSPDKTAGKSIISVSEISTEHNSSIKIECRCLDHVDSLGLMLISSRGRYLINWLVSALMKLEHPNRLDNFPLVTFYGPRVKFDRGLALAFNIYDWKKEKVEPLLVQKLADRNNISVGHGFLNHICYPKKYAEDTNKMTKEKEISTMKSRKEEQGISVVTVALTFLANFEDVYRLWSFIAHFLDADFVEKERWRYTALNHKTIEV